MFPTPNTTINGKDFYVSLNTVDVSIYGCETTALVVGQMEKFYILNGNHLSQYKALIANGFNECFDYFVKNLDKINKRSDKL